MRIYSLRKEGAWFCVGMEEDDSVSFSSFSPKSLNHALQAYGGFPGEGWKVEEKPSPEAKEILEALAEAYMGRETNVKPPLALGRLSPFTRRVLEAVREVPRGFTATYRGVAEAVGVPRGARAVGNAVAGNPFSLLVPCHRIIKSDLTLGRYGLGASVKLMLLKREGVKIYLSPSSRKLRVDVQHVLKKGTRRLA
ncbi:MGMT family protein [Candidatus Hecatella orcuttiae]|jgi:methylated-DNA-[protein]-cysteine S-methyltransferase|uniref:methylated-DNA--[protein]-cysteine S-methyltransferase n=1 Tax=Candidatus Hecatella orcuttiae TaxID=1935119 RepID=UPI0028683A64|nr:MGMT family protein [Candidatus Hecatella orcuttiae]